MRLLISGSWVRAPRWASKCFAMHDLVKDLSCYILASTPLDISSKQSELSFCDNCSDIKTLWRNGSASDSRSEGCVFKSRQGQTFCFKMFCHAWPCYGSVLLHSGPDAFDLIAFRKSDISTKQSLFSFCVNCLEMKKTLWRNGSASDSRSEGCVFKSRQGQNFLHTPMDPFLFLFFSFFFLFFCFSFYPPSYTFISYFSSLFLSLSFLPIFSSSFFVLSIR